MLPLFHQKRLAKFWRLSFQIMVLQGAPSYILLQQKLAMISEPVKFVDPMALEQALFIPVVAVASPSAVRAWLRILPESPRWDNAVACIGETTAVAANKLGFRNVYLPANPGLEGWIGCILGALKAHSQVHEV